MNILSDRHLAFRILQVWRKYKSINSRVRGDFHTHTEFSDGIDITENLIQRAKEHCYQWFALSDHAPSTDGRYHLTVYKFFKRTEIAERASARNGIKVYHSIEADILDDGSVNIPPEIRDTLHFALASFYHIRGGPPDRLLRRIDTAFGDDRVVGWAHPFFSLDQQKDRPFIMDVLELAEKHGVAVEFNLAPQYMDGNLPF